MPDYCRYLPQLTTNANTPRSYPHEDCEYTMNQMIMLPQLGKDGILTNATVATTTSILTINKKNLQHHLKLMLCLTKLHVNNILVLDYEYALSLGDNPGSVHQSISIQVM